MIVGIDESGNFDENSNLRQFFIAAFIETENSKLEIKKRQYLSWENRIPANCKNANGEVKGSLLNTGQLQAFLKLVVFDMPLIRTSIVSIIPSKNAKSLIEKYQKFEIKQTEYNYELYTARGSKKYNINFLDNYLKWQKKRSLRDYLKMHCLKHLLKDTFHNAVVHSILNERIEEVINFSYKIDKDFLTEENIFWEHYSKTSIENYTKENPFPMLDTWDDNHPFVKKYLFTHKGNTAINLRTVYENLKFLDSKDHFEIRIADILGIIYNRHFNRNEFIEEYKILAQFGATREAHIEIVLNDFDADLTFKEYVAAAN